MTATTTPETSPGPVVVPAWTALTSAAERFRRTEDAVRKSLAPSAFLAVDLGREVARAATATETLTRQLSATRDALDGIVRWAGEIERQGKSAEVARLGREARRIARGNTRISVTLARLLTALRDNGQTLSADLVTSALLGDPDALAYWHGVVGKDDGLALVVVTILEDLEGMRADADALAAEVADLVASVSLTDLPDTAEPIPPPRITLAGSLDLHAPPVAALSATAGIVLTAERSPMR